MRLVSHKDVKQLDIFALLLKHLSSAPNVDCLIPSPMKNAEKRNEFPAINQVIRCPSKLNSLSI